MIEEINHKTPDEIKKRLERCKEDAHCNACASSYHCQIEEDALALIQQLEEQNDELELFCANESTRRAETDLNYVRAINAIAAQMPKWISVKDDTKPRHGKEYLCVCTLPDDTEHEWDWIMVLRWYGNGGNGYVDRPHFTDEGVNGMTVTHWMQLPELPKEA